MRTILKKIFLIRGQDIEVNGKQKMVMKERQVFKYLIFKF